MAGVCKSTNFHSPNKVKMRIIETFSFQTLKKLLNTFRMNANAPHIRAKCALRSTRNHVLSFLSCGLLQPYANLNSPTRSYASITIYTYMQTIKSKGKKIEFTTHKTISTTAYRNSLTSRRIRKVIPVIFTKSLKAFSTERGKKTQTLAFQETFVERKI